MADKNDRRLLRSERLGKLAFILINTVEKNRLQFKKMCVKTIVGTLKRV